MASGITTASWASSVVPPYYASGGKTGGSLSASEAAKASSSGSSSKSSSSSYSSSYGYLSTAYKESMAKTQADIAKAASQGKEYVRGKLVNSMKSKAELVAIAENAASLASKHAAEAGTSRSRGYANEAQKSVAIAQNIASYYGEKVTTKSEYKDLITLSYKDPVTGEHDLVERSELEGLTQAQKDRLSLIGVDAFNTVMSQEYADFTKRNIQLDTGEWVERAYYNSLPKGKQTLLMTEGVDKYNRLETYAAAKPVSTTKSKVVLRKELTESLLKTATPSLIFPVPGTKLMATLLLKPSYDAAVAAGLKAAGVESIENITTDKQKAAYRDASVKTYADQMAYTFVPFYWVKEWNNMSATERAINIAIDAAIFVPAIKSGVSALRVRLSPTRASEIALKQLLENEAKRNTELAKVIRRTYGNQAAKNLLAVDKAQARYIEQLVKLDRLTSSGKASTSTIKLNKLKAESLASELEAKAKIYTKSLQGKVGFDSPTVSRMIDELPREVVRNAKAAVEGIRLTKVNIKTLQSELTSIKDELQKITRKKSGADNKVKSLYDSWVDAGKPEGGSLRTQLIKARLEAKAIDEQWGKIQYEYAQKQVRLMQATEKGSVSEVYAEMLRTYDDFYRAKTVKERLALWKKLSQLSEKVDTYIKSMEVEWGRGGFLTKGKVAVEAPKITTPSTGGTTKLTTGIQVRQLAPAISTIKLVDKLYNLTDDEINKIEPMTVRDINKAVEEVSKTDASIQEYIQPLTESAVNKALEILTGTGTELRVSPAVEAYIREQIKLSTSIAVQPKLQAQVKAITKTAVKIAERIITRIPPPKKTIRVNLPDGTSHVMTRYELAGAVGWKQGFIYKMIFPPYGKNQIVNSLKPIQGIPYKSGARSAYESIVKLRGAILPGTIKRDMGIMDIVITTPHKGGPKIRFKRDIKQKTRITPSLGAVRM